MTRAEIERICEDAELVLVNLDGMEEACLGIGSSYQGITALVYSQKKILEVLARDMSEEDAVDFFDFNIACLYAGEHTPIILDDTCHADPTH